MQWFLLSIGCSSLTGAPTTPVAAAQPSAIDQALLEVAQNYRGWGRLDDVARWTPMPCADAGARGRQDKPAGMSGAKEGPHRTKLYFLHARDPAAYLSINWVDPSPVGQALVKESFTPVETDQDGTAELPVASDNRGKHYRAGAQTELFVMLKLPEHTPDTDDGWVYAIVEPDHTLRESGVITGCKACHHAAKSDHLFGVGARAD